MFDKIKFAQIIKKIKEIYESQEDFAKKSDIGRTYLSQYMNMKLEEPPKPKILEKLADASKGLTSYNELMQICGYMYITQISKDTYSNVAVLTDFEWKLLFGDNETIKLTDNEALAWSNLIENMVSPDNIIIGNIMQLDYNLDNYLKYAINTNEEDMISRLFFFFLLMLCKYTNNKKSYDLVIESIKDMNFSSLSLYTEMQLFNIPILGKIAAGQPILTDEYLEGYLPTDPNVYGMTTQEDYFYLRVSGESMNLKIHNGDYALIHKQDYAENGDIVVAIVNGDDEATLKRYKRINNDIIMLEPMSTLPMEPIVINLKETDFKIIGKAIGQFGKF